MRLQTRDLTQTRRWLSDDERAGLLNVIAASFNRVAPADYLAKYFDSPGVRQRKLRLYLDGDALVGYCLLTFTDERAWTIIRASAGFLPDYRKGGHTFRYSIRQSFVAWLRRPWRRTYYADTMLSPAMYRATAKHAGIVWPHPDHTAPGDLFDRLNPDGHVAEENGVRCLLRVHRATRYHPRDVAAFRQSDKPEIQHFCTLNPDFHKGVALFVIMPLGLRQFWRSWRKPQRADDP
ncbi:MAG: hypothetical protein AAFU65_15570 [Pseudomonadota bacterium]